jgi:hypothetical protein
MKLLLDIHDDKAAFILELLENFKFVKLTPLTIYHAGVLESLKDAVEEVNEIKAGKKYSQSLSSFLDNV